MGKKASVGSTGTNNNSISSGNGGIMGSGVFGMFGSTVNCKAEDNSIYCSIIKIFNIMIILFIVCIFIYFLYSWYNSKK
jgi:hypothetical protein